MRVSLISLAGVIAFGLFAYLILALPHPEWRGLVENTLAVLMILMLVAAFAGKHRSRAFGVGFVAATALYLSACFAPAISFRDKLHKTGSAEIDRCIFEANSNSFLYLKSAKRLSISQSVFPDEADLPMRGNSSATGVLQDPENGNYQPRHESAGYGKGANVYKLPLPEHND